MKHVFCAVGAAVMALGASSVEVKVDFGRETGPVKPVNGVGQPPLAGGPQNFTMIHYLKEAGIPCSRLHDVGGWFGGNLYVDIPNLFRDFDADENDPKNYDFACTDRLLLELEKNGVEPLFRLGVTIENFASIANYRISPPKDYAKWARICEHVVRHYTEGWADGYRMRITHWEIWNEPDISDRIEKSMMWRAPYEEYLKLYETASKHLKGCFPHLKIGGPASCGFLSAVNPRTPYYRECHPKRARQFLEFVRDRKCPLDFFSFHGYAELKWMLPQIDYARSLLAEFGFGEVELWLDEWLPKPSREKLGSAQQASEVAAALLAFQNARLDAACIYDAGCNGNIYTPLFNPLTLRPHKAYYAYTAFNELRKCGTAVFVACDGDLKAVAAKGAGGAALMLANDTEDEVGLELDLGDYVVKTCRMTDDDVTDEVSDDPPEALPPYSFAVLTLEERPDLAERRLADDLPRILDAALAHYRAVDPQARAVLKDPALGDCHPYSWDAKTGGFRLQANREWTAGSFPGVYWRLYEATGEAWARETALFWTERLRSQSRMESGHDIGTIMLNSFGNAARLLKTDAYDDLLLESAETLMKRYDAKLGLVRSQGAVTDAGEFIVVPDGMVNIELLEWASRKTHDPKFHKAAFSHADATSRNFYRPDGGSRHVLDFDRKRGVVKGVRAGQGLSVSTTWSRGMAWSVYGFTMMARETGNDAFLARAMKCADHAIGNVNMPSDGVPPWDYGAPDEERDSAAAAIMASALVELSTLAPKKAGARYRAFAVRQLRTLASPAYFAAQGENGDFLLKHAVVAKPQDCGSDVPLVCGDYYFLEALIRLRSTADSRKVSEGGVK